MDGPGEKPMNMINYKGEEKQIICQDEGYRWGRKLFNCIKMSIIY